MGRVFDLPETTEGGILLPENTRKELKPVLVVTSIGEAVPEDSQVRVGDLVLVGLSPAVYDDVIDGQRFAAITYEAVLCILADDERLQYLSLDARVTDKP